MTDSTYPKSTTEMTAPGESKSIEAPKIGKHIMLVEDDVSLAQWIADYLTSQGYDVTLSNNGEKAIELIREDQPDLVILDISLPGKDGFDVCREVRAFYHHPILMMTARIEETDEVLGLELGASDYVTKPVRPRALLARIKGLLKRDNSSQSTSTPNTDSNIPNTLAKKDHLISLGSLEINRQSRSTKLDDKLINISSNEFDVLWFLALNAGEIISRDQLLKEIRGIEYDGFDRSMDVLVSRIRKKLNEVDKPERIKTIWGKGYLLVPDA